MDLTLSSSHLFLSSTSFYSADNMFSFIHRIYHTVRNAIIRQVNRFIHVITHSIRTCLLLNTLLILQCCCWLITTLYRRIVHPSTILRTFCDFCYLHSALLQRVFRYHLNEATFTTTTHTGTRARGVIESLCHRHGVIAVPHTLICSDSSTLIIHQLKLQRMPFTSSGMSQSFPRSPSYRRTPNTNPTVNTTNTTVVFIAGLGTDCEHYLAMQSSSSEETESLPVQCLRLGYTVWLIHARDSKYFTSNTEARVHYTLPLCLQRYLYRGRERGGRESPSSSFSLAVSDVSRVLSYIQAHTQSSSLGMRGREDKLVLLGYSTACALIVHALKYLSFLVKTQLQCVIVLSPKVRFSSSSLSPCSHRRPTTLGESMEWVLRSFLGTFLVCIPRILVYHYESVEVLTAMRDIFTESIYLSLCDRLYRMSIGGWYDRDIALGSRGRGKEYSEGESMYTGGIVSECNATVAKHVLPYLDMKKFFMRVIRLLDDDEDVTVTAKDTNGK